MAYEFTPLPPEDHLISEDALFRAHEENSFYTSKERSKTLCESDARDKKRRSRLRKLLISAIASSSIIAGAAGAAASAAGAQSGAVIAEESVVR